MNYINQLNAYWEWSNLQDVSHAQHHLYTSLLALFNNEGLRRSRLTGIYIFPKELAIPNLTVMSTAKISDKKQFAAERSALVDLGLIEYVPGKLREAGIYSIIPLYSTEKYPQAPLGVTTEITPDLPPINKTKIETKTEINMLSSKDDGDSAQIQEVFDSYNEICRSLPHAEKLTAKRKSQIRRRLKTYSIAAIKEAFTRSEQSDFLSGRSKDWRASLDWFMGNDDNILKVIEGKYDNNSTHQFAPQSTHQSSPQYTEMAPTEGIEDIEAAFRAAYS